MRANGSNIEIGLLLNIDYRVDWDRLSHIPGRPDGRQGLMNLQLIN